MFERCSSRRVLPGHAFPRQRAQLQITWPDGRQERFDLDLDIVRVGRAESLNNLIVPEALFSISRQHLEIRRSGAEYWLSDSPELNLDGEEIINIQDLRVLGRNWLLGRE